VIQCEREPAVERDGALVLPDRRVQREPARKLFASEEGSQRRQGFRASSAQADVANRRRRAYVAEHIECDGVREPIDPIRLIRPLNLDQSLSARDVEHETPQPHGVGAFQGDRAEKRQASPRAPTQVSRRDGIGTPLPTT